MRGTDHEQNGMFSYISSERRVPRDHPLQSLRVMVDAALKALGPRCYPLRHDWTAIDSAREAAAGAIGAVLYSVPVSSC
jgi:hypothetical protein